MSNIPKDLKYTNTHEWVRDEGNGTVTVGITDHAQELLGDIVFVQLPDISKTVAQSADFAVIESVKAAADVYAPIAGEIVAVNDNLQATPELINQDPYGEGWLCRLRVGDHNAIASLLDPSGYAESIK